MRDGHPPRGYALLITLVMLALLGVILGGLARRSADAAIDANVEEQAVRLQWARLTCSHTMLRNVQERFDRRAEAWFASLDPESESPAGWDDRPASHESVALALRGLHLTVRIDDEQAKINLNHALRQAADTFVSPDAVIAESLSDVWAPTPQFTRPEFVELLRFQPLESWQQAMPGSSPKNLLGIKDAANLLNPRLSGPAETATLWGDGRLNLFSAPEAVLQRGLRDRVDPYTIQRLIRLRQEDPGLGLTVLIENAAPDRQEDRRALTAALTDRSTCFALWINCAPDTPSHSVEHWTLSVREGDGGAATSSAANPSLADKRYDWRGD